MNVAFKLILVNHSSKDIYIGQRCTLSLIRAQGGTSSTFYIVKAINDGTGAATALGGTEYIKMPADPGNISIGGTPTTAYFAATAIGGSTVQSTPTQSDIGYVMIGLTGTYTATSSSDKYSQLIAFKTIYVL